MAYVVGIGLVILVFAGIPLQALGHPGLANVVGVVHGILYIVYLLAAYGLYRRAHFTFWQLVAMVLAGFVPFLAFYVERRTTKRIERDLAEFKVRPDTR
jgi:integral membrane protein